MMIVCGLFIGLLWVVLGAAVVLLEQEDLDRISIQECLRIKDLHLQAILVSGIPSPVNISNSVKKVRGKGTLY